uniref:PX domain-containing protein n=1 Tax=Phytophthora ramorum TaxID=164328 RepID=H3GT61_PHYRM
MGTALLPPAAPPRRRASETQRLSSTIGQAFFCLQTRPQPVAPFASGTVLSFHAPGEPDAVRERLARLLSLSAAMMAEPDVLTKADSDGDASETADAFRPADDDLQQLTVQSLPYVKCRESVSAVFSFDSAARRRVSLASNATSDTANSSPEHADKFPTSLSYSVPSTAIVTNTPRGRPAVDVIATYMNTCDQRTVKSELMRAHAHFASPRGGPPSRIRSSSIMSKEGSAEWGWFADIDSSSESWGGDGSIHSLRRRLSADLGLIDVGNVHVLGDEQTNTRITAAHKTFTIVTEGNSKVVSATVSIPKFRIVQSRSGADRHAQYLITLMLGKELYADWRRYSEFGELVKTLDEKRYTRTQDAWAGIETRWFNRLEPSYLHQKCITLENFMRELMYESNEPNVLINFLGGYLAATRARAVREDVG